MKNNLSRYLAQVRRGREIVVCDRDTPIARLIPFVPGETLTPARGGGGRVEKDRERAAELVRQGVLSPGDPGALASWLDHHPPVRRPAGAPSAVDILLEMRRESRR